MHTEITSMMSGPQPHLSDLKLLSNDTFSVRSIENTFLTDQDLCIGYRKKSVSLDVFQISQSRNYT